MEQWSHDGVRLVLAARPWGPAAWRRVCALAGLTLGSWIWLAADPAPPVHVDCASLHDLACAEHLPADVDARRPPRSAWVRERARGLVESVRREDRLPGDVHALDGLEGPASAASALERELVAYRAEQRGRSVHFSEATRFVAEMSAARVLEPEAGRALVDELIAGSEHAVLDLGDVPTTGLRAAATELADAEWVAHRQHEQARWVEVRSDRQSEAADDLRSWAIRRQGASGIALVGTVALALVEALRRRRIRPVHLEVDARGVAIDGLRIPRAEVVWIGLRDGRLRVVTRDGEHVSRPVADERGLIRALRAWRDLRAVDAEGALPEDLAAVNRLRRA
jgi:hypothetical protein